MREDAAPKVAAWGPVEPVALEDPAEVDGKLWIGCRSCACSSTVGRPEPRRPNLSPKAVWAEERRLDGLETAEGAVDGEAEENTPVPGANEAEAREEVGEDDELALSLDIAG